MEIIYDGKLIGGYWRNQTKHGLILPTSNRSIGGSPSHIADYDCCEVVKPTLLSYFLPITYQISWCHIYIYIYDYVCTYTHPLYIYIDMYVHIHILHTPWYIYIYVPVQFPIFWVPIFGDQLTSTFFGSRSSAQMGAWLFDVRWAQSAVSRNGRSSD